MPPAPQASREAPGAVATARVERTRTFTLTIPEKEPPPTGTEQSVEPGQEDPWLSGDGEAQLPPVPNQEAARPSGATIKALALYRQGDYRAAVTQFLLASDEHPTNGVPVLGAGLSYFQLKDFPSAAKRVEEALDKGGIDKFLAYKVLAYSYYSLDELAESRRSAEAALAIKPDEDLSMLVVRISRERPVQGDFLSESTLHFKVLYDGYEKGSNSTAVLTLLEEAYLQLGSTLNHFPVAPVTTVLYTGRDFAEITQMPDWSGGAFDGKIRLPVRGLSRYSPEQLKAVIYHEYAHALIFSISKGVPRWFNEGLAMHLAGERREWRAQVIELQSLERNFPPAQSASLLAYDISYSAVGDLIAERGMYGAGEFLQALGRGEELNSAFMNAYYKSYDDFIAQWGRN